MGTRKNSRPVYMQIAGDLRELIRSGTVVPGQRLPTEVELCATYGVTRPTVRSGYAELIKQGLVENRGTIGYFVREVRHQEYLLGTVAEPVLDPWGRRTRAGAEGRALTTVHVERAGKTIRGHALADLLDLDGDELAVRRNSLRYLEGDPSEIIDIYLPYGMARHGDFMNEEAPLDLAGALELAGLRARSVSMSFVTRNPTALEVDRLELPDATAVMDILRSVACEPDGRHLLVTHSIFPAVGAEFQIDF